MQALDLVRKNFQNIENFGNSFIKNDIIYVNLPLTYESSIILSLLKIATSHHVYFNDFNLLFKTAHHRKRDFLQPRLF